MERRQGVQEAVAGPEVGAGDEEEVAGSRRANCTKVAAWAIRARTMTRIPFV